jgi:HlyD family secretion protein
MNTKAWFNGKAERLRRLGRRRLASAGLSIGVLVVLVIWWAGASGADAPSRNVPLFEVMRGPLTVSVSESGTIKSREQEVVKNEVEGRTTILWLIPEGTAVKAGDLLIELDSATLVEERTKQQLTVLNAEASFVRAREELAVTESQAASDVEKAELESKFAQIDLQKYVEGEYRKLLQQAQAEITLSNEELTRAQGKRDWSRTLANEQYISKSELETDELAYKRADLNRQIAEVELEVLEKYTHRRELEQLESDVRQTAAALERARLKANSDITQAKSELTAKQTERDRQQTQLDKINMQITKCKLYAPVSGMVVYATTGQPPWRGRGPLEEGRELREREELIYLPTAAAMKAEVKVHEASMPKVRYGLPALLTVDAVPGKTFTGRVERVSFIPDAQSSWLNPDLKVYNIEVYIDGDGGDLRPGMTCRTEIIFDQFQDVTYVPVSAVVRIGGAPVVYVMTSDGPRVQPVDIGLDNNRMVVIKSGLKQRQQVLLAPPLPDTTAERETQPQVVIPQPAGPSAPAERPPTPSSQPGGALAGPASQPASAPSAEGSGPPRQAGQPPTAEELAAAQAVLKEAGISMEDLATMTPEQRRQKFENLTPEQQQALRKLMPRRRPAGGSQGPAQGTGQETGSDQGSRRSRRGAQGSTAEQP